MTAKEFLEVLHPYDSVFEIDTEYQYTEQQLINFAERYHEAKLKPLGKKELLSDENIKKMANEYTGGEEDYKAFILACNVIAEKIIKLC